MEVKDEMEMDKWIVCNTPPTVNKVPHGKVMTTTIGEVSSVITVNLAPWPFILEEHVVILWTTCGQDERVSERRERWGYKRPETSWRPQSSDGKKDKDNVYLTVSVLPFHHLESSSGATQIFEDYFSFVIQRLCTLTSLRAPRMKHKKEILNFTGFLCFMMDGQLLKKEHTTTQSGR